MPDPLVSTTRLRALRSAMGSGDRPVLIVIHDYPDPDAIGAAMAMQTLAGSWGISASIAHGGGIGREENAEMVRLLKIELKTFDAIPDLDDYRGAVFVDTQPLAKNQSMPDGIPVLGVVDHHSLGDDSVRLTATSATGTIKLVYSDIRTEIGASSTLACGYIEAAGIIPDARLATALFLGIKTDTDGLLCNACEADINAYVRLLPLSDLNLAAQVVHPPIDQSQIRFFHLATRRALIYGAALISVCDEVRSPDQLSTASDALILIRGISYALAVGFSAGRVFLSLRAKPPRADATRVLLRVVEPEGKGGGHGISAGGYTDMDLPREKCVETIVRRFLDATGETGKIGVRLIPEGS